MNIERIKIAVEFLRDGKPFKVCDLGLGMIDHDNIYVTGWTKYQYLTNITKQTALDELLVVKEIFADMVNSSNDLKNFVNDKSIKYNLAFTDGKVGVGICSEQEGIVTWHI